MERESAMVPFLILPNLFTFNIKPVCRRTGFKLYTHMVDWNKVREEFPVCKKYVYLNPAGGSPVSKSAADEGKRFFDEMLEFGDTYWETWLERTEVTRSALAEFIGATREEIGFTTNTSQE